ncbi:Cof-type HAD-IIB family hydrolase [Streptococcus dentiloxodontae]
MKILATDMDGTFLDGQGTYDKKRLERLLDACDAKGYLFAVASGRALIALEKLFEDFVERIVLIAENGSVIQYKGNLLYEAKMAREDYLHTADVIQSFADCQGLLLSGRKGAYAPLDSEDAYIERVKHYYENVQLTDLAAVTDDVFKLTAQFTDETVLEREDWLNANLQGKTAVTTGFDAMDIIIEGVDKGFGLEHLCQELSLPVHDVIAFGDNLNDKEMLIFAGSAIATENARDEIKAIADEVIGHHADGAVMDYMERLVNNG